MRQFLSFFRQFLKPLANSNTCIFVNIAWKMNCDILKSKLILCEWNAFYFIEIAFIGFTLDEIKQCIVFFGTPGRTIRYKSIRQCGQCSSHYSLLHLIEPASMGKQLKKERQHHRNNRNET